MKFKWDSTGRLTALFSVDAGTPLRFSGIHHFVSFSPLLLLFLFEDSENDDCQATFKGEKKHI